VKDPAGRADRRGLFSLKRIAACLLAAGFVFGPPASAQDNSGYVGNFFPYAAFNELPPERIDVGGGVLIVAFAPGSLRLPHAEVMSWIARCAGAVADYFGRLPAQKALLLVIPSQGRGVHGGSTYSYRGAASRILLGEHSGADDLAADWVLVHELTHHAMPSLPEQNHWMEEGLATYVEPIARAQRGELAVETVWRDLVAGLPKGMPQAGDRGLDATPTWGRTYWGGAAFYLLADIEIRKRTENAKGLQDGLRAVVAQGGNITQEWSVRKVLQTADRGTGTRVLQELYAKMSVTPSPIDLETLWRELGVTLKNGTVEFDDAAPLAAIRRAITKPRENP
jgi:hypothetical protein